MAMRAILPFRICVSMVLIGIVGLPRLLRAQGTVVPPGPFLQPVISPGATLYAGVDARISQAEGYPYSSVQWNFNGKPIPGATGSRLDLLNLSAANAGNYSFTVTNSAGSTTSPSTPLNVLPDPPGVDPAFVTSLMVTGSTYSTPSSPVLVAQPDGKILVAGSIASHAAEGSHAGLTRLNSDGSEDPSFHIGSGIAGGVVRQIFLLSNQQILLTGTFTSINSVACPGIARLNPDGTLDPAFSVDPAVLGLSYPVVMLPDEHLLGFKQTGVNNIIKVTRLLSNGATDTTFSPYDLPATPTGAQINLTTGLQDLDANNRVIFAGPGDDTRYTFVCRFQADGQLNLGLPPLWRAGSFRTLRAIGNKIAYSATVRPIDPFARFNPFDKVTRLTEDGAVDSTFQSVNFFTRTSTVFLDDGGAIVVENEVTPAAATATSCYDSSGKLVHGSVPRFDGRGVLIDLLRLLPNDQLFAVGRFWGLDTVPTRGVARLNLSGETYATRLANLSIRTHAGRNDQTLIAGFVVGGTQGNLKLLARGIGPTLASFGVTDALPDPSISIHLGSSTPFGNTDWPGSLTGVFVDVGAFALPAGSKDAALVSDFDPGIYSLEVFTASPTTGTALAELYDADPASASASRPRLVNLSGRANVASTSDALIAGFVVSGTGIKRLLIRGVGPTLADYGVGGALPSVKLSVYRGTELIAFSTTPASDYGATLSVGAFPLTTNDAALVLDLGPGVYSAAVRGQNGGTGIALVEIYEVP